MTPEISRPVIVARIGAQGLDVVVDATIDECRDLAARMGIPSVGSLTCAFHLTRGATSGVILARGVLRARVTRTCVISAEDFEAAVAEDFTVRFVPEAEDPDEIDPDGPDEIQYDGMTVDLGEAAAEQLGLALDPYPRMPGAVSPEVGDDGDDSPFAALGRSRGSSGGG